MDEIQQYAMEIAEFADDLAEYCADSPLTFMQNLAAMMLALMGCLENVKQLSVVSSNQDLKTFDASPFAKLLEDLTEALHAVNDFAKQDIDLKKG